MEQNMALRHKIKMTKRNNNFLQTSENDIKLGNRIYSYIISHMTYPTNAIIREKAMVRVLV